MFPKSTFEIFIDEEILFFKDVWAYIDSGIRGDVISSDDQLELEWSENFENVTTKCDDNMWISYKVPYIKHCWDGIKRMQRLDTMHGDYMGWQERNHERTKRAKEKLKLKQKKKVIKLGTEQYTNNPNYRVKVNTLTQYAILAKKLHHGFLLHHNYNDFKLGLYMTCMSFNILLELSPKHRSDYLQLEPIRFDSKV